MILHKETICDPFTIYKEETIKILGLVTIGFTNRITNQYEIVRLDIHSEMIANALPAIRGICVTTKLANKGFRISPIPNSLERFFHLLLFPEDANTFNGKIETTQLPTGITPEVISSKS